MFFIIFFLFFGGLLIANGPEVLTLNSLWGVLFLCFILLFLISSIFSKNIKSDERSIYEREKEKIESSCKEKVEELRKKLNK